MESSSSGHHPTPSTTCLSRPFHWAMAAPRKRYNSHVADRIKTQSLPPSHCSINLASPPCSAAVGRIIRQINGCTGRCLGRPGHPSSSSSSPGGEAPCRGLSHGAVELETLETFSYKDKVDGGSLEVRLMKPEDMDATVKLLADAIADATRPGPSKIRFLKLWVKQWLEQKMQRRGHVAILVGLYRGGDETEEPRLAGTAEVSFDDKGAGDDIPTPTPPRGAPYISNVTVDKALRRCTSPPPISC